MLEVKAHITVKALQFISPASNVRTVASLASWVVCQATYRDREAWRRSGAALREETFKATATSLRV
jgi:hypothetical protein